MALLHRSPSFRPSLSEQVNRWFPVVVNQLLQHFLFVRILFSKDFKRILVVLPRVDIAARNPDCLARQSHKPLDVVLLHIFRIAEDNHVPSVGVADLIGKFVDQNPIPLEDRQVANFIVVSTVRTNRFVKTPHQITVVVQFIAGSDFVFVVTLFTDNILVASEQCRCHRPRRNDERFGHERAEEQCEDEGKRDRFERFAHGVLRRNVDYSLSFRRSTG